MRWLKELDPDEWFGLAWLLVGAASLILALGCGAMLAATALDILLQGGPSK